VEEDITKVTVCYSVQEDERERERVKMRVEWGFRNGRREYGVNNNNNNNNNKFSYGSGNQGTTLPCDSHRRIR